VSSPSRGTGRVGATMTWPDEYGYLLRSAIEVSPRRTTRESASGSLPADSSQNTQPACSPACAMYSRRHGAHRDFGMRRFYHRSRAKRPSPLVGGRSYLGRGTFVAGTQTFGAATLDLKWALPKPDDAEL